MIRHIYTLLIVMIGWVFFRADTLSSALNYIKHFFIINGKDFEWFLYETNSEQLFYLFVGIYLSMLRSKISSYISSNIATYRMYEIAMFGVFLLSVMYMINNGFGPFLYYRF